MQFAKSHFPFLFPFLWQLIDSHPSIENISNESSANSRWLNWVSSQLIALWESSCWCKHTVLGLSNHEVEQMTCLVMFSFLCWWYKTIRFNWQWSVQRRGVQEVWIETCLQYCRLHTFTSNCLCPHYFDWILKNSFSWMCGSWPFIKPLLIP